MLTFRRTTCPQCRAKLEPGQRIHAACIQAYADAQQAKAERAAAKQARAAAKIERAEIRKRKESVKSKAEWAREAQTAFNAYIRLRDDADPCISCGRYHQGQWHAGHYQSVGAHPEMRFLPLNCHKQCQPCNTHLSGNHIEYRKRLIQRIGVDLVEKLEGPQEAKRYTVDDLKAIKAEYTAKARELRRLAA